MLLALLSPHSTLRVHPVNYFVSGYLQRAVNSCRADYTDRFIALVSQSNVRNAPPAATHARPVAFQASLSFPDSPSALGQLSFGFRLRSMASVSLAATLVDGVRLWRILRDFYRFITTKHK